MKRFVGLVLLILVIAACKRNESETVATDTGTAPAETATAPDTATTAVPPKDLSFATTASMANLYEINAGKLALERASGAAYKEFAQTMVTQHGEIGDSYKPIAEKQGLPAPTELSGEFKTLYDALVAAQAGAAFDALYRQQMITTHDEAVPLFQGEADTGQDPELKAFAARWVSTIQHHFDMSKALPAAQ